MFTCICTKTLQLELRQLYGSSRLGVITHEVRIAENASWPNVLPTHDTANAPFVLWNADSTYQDSVFINPFDSVGYKIKVNKYLGYRNYELSNHLGNVLAVISDRKYGEDADTDGELELFKPNVLSETDYYAFGSEVKERSVSGGYKFGFNGKMKDDEIYGFNSGYSFRFRILDSRLCIFLSVDPVSSDYSGLSPYHFGGLSPIQNEDFEGLQGNNSTTNRNYGQTRINISQYNRQIRTTETFQGGMRHMKTFSGNNGNSNQIVKPFETSRIPGGAEGADPITNNENGHLLEALISANDYLAKKIEERRNVGPYLLVNQSSNILIQFANPEAQRIYEKVQSDYDKKKEAMINQIPLPKIPNCTNCASSNNFKLDLAVYNLKVAEVISKLGPDPKELLYNAAKLDYTGKPKEPLEFKQVNLDIIYGK